MILADTNICNPRETGPRRAPRGLDDQHHVPRLLTFNDGDFQQFGEIIAVNPFDVLGIPSSAP